MSFPIRRRHFLSLSAAAWPLAAAAHFEKASAAVEAVVRSGKLKAAALRVEEGGKHYEAYFGTATASAKFLIASISKPMTASGVMWLVERGKLRLEDPVGKFLPEFQAGERAAMTIRHLLTHTCGLPDMLPENTELRKKNAPLDEYVALSLKTPLLFAPGAKWSYSSTGILLAAEIARRLDGRPIARLLEEEIYRPLGMRDTAMGLGRFRLADTVRSQTEYAPGDLGGAQDAEKWDWNSAYWRGLGAPWGGAHSTARDIAKFVGSFLRPSGKPLSQASAALMVRNQNAPGIQPYGIGWSVGSRLGKGLPESAFGHGGSTGTLCWADPGKDRLFVLLTSLPDVVARKAVIQPVSEILASS